MKINIAKLIIALQTLQIKIASKHRNDQLRKELTSGQSSWPRRQLGVFAKNSFLREKASAVLPIVEQGKKSKVPLEAIKLRRHSV